MKLKGIELKGTYKVKFANTFFEIYNERGNPIYLEDSSGFWSKKEHDERGNQIYYEDSSGNIFDKRVKELTIKEIEELLGYKIKIKEDRK